jgi:hypothetical protein
MMQLKKVHQAHSKVSVILTVFSDYEGPVYHEYAPQG